MISQCGSQQQLRRALELVAEMRSRGIQCNVHTYSALMNVCIKGETPAAAAACCGALSCAQLCGQLCGQECDPELAFPAPPSTVPAQ